tara:strand:+ start:1753 stop:2433 length:681 start_codon:yes stop_codon:yes gene_type:complete
MSEAEIKNTESTETPVEATETQDKLFTQQDLDKIVADRVSRERRKYEKKYEGVDIDTYQDLMTKAEKEREDKLKAKGEFEKLLKEQAEKKDSQISQLMKTVETIKVDGSLVDEASKAGSINPQQVAQLLRNQVRLGEAGEVEITDPKTGQVRYKDDGTHMTVQNLVREFITANKHFLSATPSGMGTTGSRVGDAGKAGETLDITKLDMSKAKDREIYAQYKESRKK